MPSSKPQRPVWVIGHRGASREFPENTLIAFDQALRRGADGVECDLQLSRDGVPVVYHDRTLTRAGGGRRRVARMDLAQLKRLDPGARIDARFRGQHIPTLERLLNRYAGRTRLLLEIKMREGRTGRKRHHELARAVARAVSRRRDGRKTMILCFDTEVLEVCEDQAPRVPRVLNLKPPRTLTRTLSKRLPSLYAVSADVRRLTPAFGAARADHGTPLLVYTCNTPRRVQQALAAGATGIMSDRPGWLARYLDDGA